MFLKKLKHEPGLKKPGDFTVSEGHGYPLVLYNILGVCLSVDTKSGLNWESLCG
jgi:hypothetical protein